MRALLVDDEAPARERLRRLLRSFEDVEIVGEAEDGEAALEKIEALMPDLVFLDIQMPGCTGLEVAASLPTRQAPRIIFCTAYDEYAVDAFELHAVDYLLKPVSRARLQKAVERIREAAPVALPPAAGVGHPLRFLAKRGNRFHVIHARQVLFFGSEDGITKLQAVQQHYWMAPTLSDLERRLDPARFFRVSRAAIVHLEAVQEVIPRPGGSGDVELKDGTRLEVSRRRFRELMDRLAG